MKRYSLLFKFLAFVLASLCFLTTMLCGYGIFSLLQVNLYQKYPDSLAQGWCYDTGLKRAETAAKYYAATTLGQCPKELVEVIYNGSGYYGGSQIIIKEQDEVVRSFGEVVEGGITIDYLLTIDYPVVVPTEEDEDSKSADADQSDNDTSILRPIQTYDVRLSDGRRITYQVRFQEISLNATVTLDQSILNNTNYQLLSWIFPYRYTMIWGLGFSLLLGISMLVYLLYAAGRNRQGLVEPVGLCRLPLDGYLAAVALLFFLLLQLFYAAVGTVYSYHVILFVILSIALFVPSLLGLMYILAAQSKLGGGHWWRHSIIGRCGRLCGKGIYALLQVLPTVWQWLVVGCGMVCITLGSFILGFGNRSPFFRLVFFLCGSASLALVCYSGYCFSLLLIGSKKMAAGQLDHQIPERHLFGSFRDCARQLNALSGAANAAMQSKIRSERMKTELITNVSHDIKTPLTSIINFVDLLEKPHSPEEGSQYLEVLSRQSQQLKKLIEDLMDLSKASTGNMNVNTVTLDAVEVVNQAVGEFADKLEQARLTAVIRGAETPLPIRADGRLVWRILSNLLGNIVKYATPNTRVYLDLADSADGIRLSLRNISRNELNITAEDLLERFVRGDASRNTEGSGLGLNIAKSLMEVQQGSLELTLDGDLFKVTLIFPKA